MFFSLYDRLMDVVFCSFSNGVFLRFLKASIILMKAFKGQPFLPPVLAFLKENCLFHRYATGSCTFLFRVLWWNYWNWSPLWIILDTKSPWLMLKGSSIDFKAIFLDQNTLRNSHLGTIVDFCYETTYIQVHFSPWKSNATLLALGILIKINWRFLKM